MSGHRGGWTILPLQGSVGAVIQSFTTLSFWKAYERRTALRLAFLLLAYNFHFLKSFTDKIHLAEVGNMMLLATWMMLANHFRKRFSIGLTKKKMKQCKYFSNNFIIFFASVLHRESVLCLRPKTCHT